MSADVPAPGPSRAVTVALFGAAVAGPAAYVLAASAGGRHEIAIAWVLAVAAIQFVVLARLRRARAYLVRGLWLTPLPNLLAATLLDPLAGVLTVAAGLASVLVGLGIAQSLAARARARALSRSLVLTDDDPEQTWRRDRAALGLVVPAMALALLFVPLATIDPSGWVGPGTPREAPAPRTSGPGEVPDDGADDRGTTDVGGAPGEFDPWLARKVVVEAAPFRDGRPTGFLGPLYLRMLVHVDVGADGTWRDEAPRAVRVRDADDGTTDGWCDVDRRPAAADALELAVRHTDLQHAPTGRTVLLAPPGVASVSLPQVRSVRGAMLLTDVDAGPKLSYHLLCRDPHRLPYPADRSIVARRDARAVFVPPGLAAADALATEAQAAASGATTDLAKVRAVVRHVREKFQYVDVGAPPGGTTALEAFVATRAGTCEQFSQATVVMLRSLGLPARVASGFLLRSWDTEQEAYVGRGRDAHAWVEVDFAGCDWVVFDPTPDSGDDDGQGRPRVGAGAEPDPEPLGPSAATPELPDGGVPTPEPGDALQEVLDSLATPADHAWLWALALLVVLAFVGRALLRRAETLETSAARPHGLLRARSPWERLVAELARRGHVRATSQTPREFAAALRAADERFAPLVPLTERQLAARFGARPLSSEDERAIDAFRASL